MAELSGQQNRQIPAGHIDHDHYKCLTCFEVFCDLFNNRKFLDSHQDYHRLSAVPLEASL